MRMSSTASFLATYWTPRDNITQVIFPGAHSDVGGGYPEHGLADRALQWMLPNLKSQGLRFYLANIRALAPNAVDFGHDDSIQQPWDRLPKAARVFPNEVFDGLTKSGTAGAFGAASLDLDPPGDGRDRRAWGHATAGAI